WHVLGPEKKRAEDVAQGAGLDREVFNRWLHFLQPGRKYDYGSLDAWQHLLEKGGSEVDAYKVAEEFQSRIAAALKEKLAVDEKNAKAMAQAEQGESPKFFSLERNSYSLLQDLSAAPPTSDGKKKVESGPFYFSDAETARFLAGVWRGYFDALNARI